MDKASTAAAFAGIASNVNISDTDRLIAADQALDYYVSQADKLETLLSDLRKAYPDPAPYGLAHNVIARLAAIVEEDS